MYLLYLDESGNEDDPGDKYFVLGGAAVFERVTFFLAQALDEIQARHFPQSPPIEFHASAIRKGRGFWHDVDRETRENVLQEVARAIAASNDPGVVLFATAIEKSNRLWGEKAVEHATMEICNRFDLFLARRYKDHGDPQRGLLIFSQGRFDKRAKIWVKGFRELGTQWSVLRNLSDIPYFASTKETRLLQIADFVAHAVFLLYERRDHNLVSSFLHRFHQAEGILHGLVHHRSDPRAACDCPACASRSTPFKFGSWL
ncbi:MAG: DUF3800 domain-containing protein [Candidatus Binatia bacterium]